MLSVISVSSASPVRTTAMLALLLSESNQWHDVQTKFHQYCSITVYSTDVCIIMWTYVANWAPNDVIQGSFRNCAIIKIMN